MSFNPQPTDKDIAVDVLGGKVSDMNASDLPEGVSPDCADMEFLPGSVFSRRGLHKVFATPMGAVTVTYGKSYIDPVGVIRDLYLDSAGNLWVENLTSSPGTLTLLATTTPGSYAKSITAFGREYIAISDGLRGTDVPLQYDGTNLDRVTQDGPGAPPTVSCFAYPGVQLANAATLTITTITEIDPTGVTGGFFTGVNIFVSSGAAALADNIGISITVSGTNATYNITYTVTAVFGDTLIQASAYSATGAFYVGTGTITYGGPSLSRSGNVVTATTGSAHNLQPGYQAQISGVPAATIGTSVSSIVINNENNPGLATITMGTAHGLLPGLFISLTGVVGVAVGGGATAAVRVGQIVTITTTTAHGLSPGALFTGSSFAISTFNTTASVASIISPTQFTFVQVEVDATDTTGVIQINWPVPATPTPTFFQVLTAPSPTVFQIAINYSDSPSTGWTSGTVTYAWDGSFFVSTVPTATSFTYQQYGPNASTSATSGTLATPYGQAAPGQHQLQVAFLTRQDAITAPSPPVKFIANGGQYISVKDIPIGPANIKGRILCFTGAQGAYFYYIPTPPQVNGILVGTQTQIDDNTTADIILDFSDNSLFAAIGISLPGNNLANQIVLDGALGFGLYATRLLTYGQRNAIQGGTGAGGLLNMGFDGGAFPSKPTLPTGWDATLNVGGALATGHYGSGWLITTVAGAGHKGIISQPLYQNYSGSPIAIGNTQYKLRLWLKPSAATSDLTFTAAITSVSDSFSSTATISGSLMNTSGSWLEASFSLKTPAIIPADLLLSIYASSVNTSPTLLVDEMFIIYSDNPYTDEIINGSYGNNPEGFDGVSGVFGPNDTHKVMGLSEIRKTLYILTQDPGGHLHETADNGTTEPAGWDVDPTASECGLISTFALTVSQADDDTESGGETWMAWASSSGARIFSGGDVPKISQEIQPDWDSINTASLTSAWALNDPASRVLYFGLPISGTTPHRAPNRIYTMNYHQLSTASEIAQADPVHVSLTGKLSAKDNARKWCPWVLTMNGAALMYRSAGKLQPVFFNGNGIAPNQSALFNFGNVYTLDTLKLTDDDYGQIHPYYFLYFMPGSEQAQQMQIGSRAMLAYLTAQISGVGLMTITPFCDNLSNPWSLSCSRTMAINPKFDLEWTGANTVANRMAFQCLSSPVTGTDNSFVLQQLRAWLRTNARLPIRGAAR